MFFVKRFRKTFGFLHVFLKRFRSTSRLISHGGVVLLISIFLVVVVVVAVVVQVVILGRSRPHWHLRELCIPIISHGFGIQPDSPGSRVPPV